MPAKKKTSRKKAAPSKRRARRVKQSRTTAVKKGAKRTARKRTARKARRNPSDGKVLMSEAVLSIEYLHVASAKNTPYVHDFKRGDGVKMYACADGSLRIVGRKPLWGEYMTKDSE